jgi:hypothetical protein
MPPLTPHYPAPLGRTAPVDQDTAKPGSDALRRELIAIAALILGVFLACTILLQGIVLLRTGGATDVRTGFGWIGSRLVTPLIALFGWPGAALLPVAPIVYGLRAFGRFSARAEHSWLAFLIGGAVLVPIAFGLATGAAPEAHPLAGLWGSFFAFYLVPLTGVVGGVAGMAAAGERAHGCDAALESGADAGSPHGGTGVPKPATRNTVARALEPDPEELPALGGAGRTWFR